MDGCTGTRYPAGSARAALWISHSVSISSGLGMAASLSGFQLPEVLSQSAVSMVLMLSPPLIGGILGALLVHQVSGRYVREITILPGGKQMKLTRTTIFGALKTQTIPIKRVEMTIYQYNRGSIQHWYPIQWARDPYDHSRLNDDDDDDMYIDRSCASSFVDKEGLQYVFGRYLEERNPPWEHLLTRKLDPEAAMSLMLDDNDPSPQREPQQQPQTVSAEEQGGGQVQTLLAATAAAIARGYLLVTAAAETEVESAWKRQTDTPTRCRCLMCGPRYL
eukprot:jgi/Bigna1/75009/fgenesh1_pg.32_\